MIIGYNGEREAPATTRCNDTALEPGKLNILFLRILSQSSFYCVHSLIAYFAVYLVRYTRITLYYGMLP